MKTMILKICKVTTEKIKNPFERDNTMMHFYRQTFLMKFICETADGVKVYFNHSFNFTESLGEAFQGIHADKKESDFCVYVPGELQTSTWGHQQQKISNSRYGDFIVKHGEGEKIEVRARLFEKESKTGNKYLKLTHVKLTKGKL